MDEEKVTFPTFLTGLQELLLVGAILESNAKKGQWIEVTYRDGAETDYC